MSHSLEYVYLYSSSVLAAACLFSPISMISMYDGWIRCSAECPYGTDRVIVEGRGDHKTVNVYCCQFYVLILFVDRNGKVCNRQIIGHIPWYITLVDFELVTLQDLSDFCKTQTDELNEKMMGNIAPASWSMMGNIAPDQTYSPWDRCLFLKFYWYTALPICLSVVTFVLWQSWMVVTETIWPTSLKYCLPL